MSDPCVIRQGASPDRPVTAMVLGVRWALSATTILALSVSGRGEGPHLVLPLFGPSNPRDAIGMGVDTFLDPLTYASYNNKAFWSIMRFLGAALHTRSRNIESLDAVDRSSLDYYAALR